MAAIRKRIVILYTELAGYTIACLHRFADRYPDAEIHLVCWPVNPEAPFRFQIDARIHTYNRKNYTEAALGKLVSDLSPSLMVCSGWIDKSYLRLCRKWKSKIPVVLIMDNKWTGSPKQQLARIVSPFTLRRSFSHAWVPGTQQQEFARRLGFPEKNIRTGFYSADVPLFSTQYEANLQSKTQHFPRRFIYAGRYYDFKGVREMWDAFQRMKTQTGSGWELWCLGTGDVPPAEIPGVRHFGFVQPADLPPLMKETGVFILPSRVEPWGVVVQEFAAAGFPLLLSDAVGAATAFLDDGKNGFRFRAGDTEALLKAMTMFSTMDDRRLLEMGRLSHEKALTITPDTWADTLHAFIPQQ